MAHPRNKKERSEIETRKREKLYAATKNSYGSGAYKKLDGRIVRYWFLPNDRRFLRRICARAARHTADLPNGAAYKKTYDFWWSLL